MSDTVGDGGRRVGMVRAELPPPRLRSRLAIRSAQRPTCAAADAASCGWRAMSRTRMHNALRTVCSAFGVAYAQRRPRRRCCNWCCQAHGLCGSWFTYPLPAYESQTEATTPRVHGTHGVWTMHVRGVATATGMTTAAAGRCSAQRTQRRRGRGERNVVRLWRLYRRRRMSQSVRCALTLALCTAWGRDAGLWQRCRRRRRMSHAAVCALRRSRCPPPRAVTLSSVSWSAAAASAPTACLAALYAAAVARRARTPGGARCLAPQWCGLLSRSSSRLMSTAAAAIVLGDRIKRARSPSSTHTTRRLMRPRRVHASADRHPPGRSAQRAHHAADGVRCAALRALGSLRCRRRHAIPVRRVLLPSCVWCAG